MGTPRSIRLRDGDPAAVAASTGTAASAAPTTKPPTTGPPPWPADHLRGKDVLLIAGSNTEAADLARRIQAKFTELGTIGPLQAALSDGNHAGVGDLIRARLNAAIDAGGRPLANRDTLQSPHFTALTLKSGGSG